ncbi:MAG: DUF3078 domain-containing protein [candidate division Zixibacteria bacterium]|nr:DUF3078 domain-containing protein [candidate division Zixibacteria bacterium]
MKRAALALVIVLVLAVSAWGQDSLGWKPSVDFILNLTQNSYSDNWEGGEAGSVTWVASANLGLERQFPTSWNWRSALRLAYGQTHSQDAETNKWKKPFKSSDLIDFESLLRYLNWKVLPPYVAVRAISQFEDASNPDHKFYLNPLELTESAGLTRVLHKEGDNEFLTRAGIGLRQRITRTYTSSPSPATTSTTNTDGGIEWVTDGKYKIPKTGIVWKTKLTTFKALFYSRSKELKGTPEQDYWKAIDVNWENMVSAQVAKYVAVGLYVQWLYDKEVARGGRFKETIAVGLTWKML